MMKPIQMKKLLAALLKTEMFIFKKKKQLFDLIIYDDIYPHPASGFRLEEFTSLLTSIPNSKAILSGAAYKHFDLPADLHREHTDALLKDKPELAAKLEHIRGNISLDCRLFYCVFLHNMFANITLVDECRVPFVFTLYPGGGFNPGTGETAMQLRKIFSSPNFKKVIVTQRRTYDYLLDNKFCGEQDILFIFGVVVPQDSLRKPNFPRLRYGKEKTTFDLGFCANKYTKYGEDKGYPLFIEFSKTIAAKYDFVRVHVIGGFDRDVINIEPIGDRTRFYGYQNFDQLNEIFREIDLIISPNQPDKLGKGAFDGFPLGTVIEAAFNEVAVMLTDCFTENKYFEDGTELIIVQPYVDDMVKKFERLIADIDLFYENAKKGKEKFRYIYSTEYQMNPRTDLIKSLIEGNNNNT